MQRIDGMTATMMKTTAIFIDFFIQPILYLLFIGVIANSIVSVTATMLFGIWFHHYGISLLSDRLALRFLLSTTGEWVPGINIFPMWSFLVWHAIKANHELTETL